MAAIELSLQAHLYIGGRGVDEVGIEARTGQELVRVRRDGRNGAA